MNIHVKYFASIRDSMGVDSEDISIDTSLTVYELWEKLSVEKRVSDSLANLSNNLNPILCLVSSYSGPGLPNPMIKYFMFIQYH